MAVKAKRIDSELESLPKTKTALIEPMLLLRGETLPEAAGWSYLGLERGGLFSKNSSDQEQSLELPGEAGC
jgi:hypothetical protein